MSRASDLAAQLLEQAKTALDEAAAQAALHDTGSYMFGIDYGTGDTEVVGVAMRLPDGTTRYFDANERKRKFDL